MDSSISVKQLAIDMLSSGSKYDQQVTDSDVEVLISHLRGLGEYEEGMALEEIACIILLYEIQREKAKLEN